MNHLAQINIGTMVAPTDDPAVAEFMDNLDRINALADTSPGFVWRLQTDSGNATDIHVFADPLQLVNMSVWTSVEALKAYVYQSDHVHFFRRRAEWFRADAKRVALWWIQPGATPTVADGVRRADFLDRHGPSPYAFGFAKPLRPLVFETTVVDDPDTRALIDQFDAELTALAVNPCENHFSLTKEETTGAKGRMLRARLGGDLVGCGAVRCIAPGVGEIKRMFVADEARGYKIGAALLDQLELAAIELGLGELKLETSAQQISAVGLYERSGFTRCAPWGEYEATAATSQCYSKTLNG